MAPALCRQGRATERGVPGRGRRARPAGAAGAGRARDRGARHGRAPAGPVAAARGARLARPARGMGAGRLRAAVLRLLARRGLFRAGPVRAPLRRAGAGGAGAAAAAPQPGRDLRREPGERLRRRRRLRQGPAGAAARRRRPQLCVVPARGRRDLDHRRHGGDAVRRAAEGLRRDRRAGAGHGQDLPAQRHLPGRRAEGAGLPQRVPGRRAALLRRQGPVPAGPRLRRTLGPRGVGTGGRAAARLQCLGPLRRAAVRARPRGAGAAARGRPALQPDPAHAGHAQP